MTRNPVFSGKADRIHIQGDHALICDFKTGRSEAESAQKNPQLRALAVLVAMNIEAVNRVTVAIIQPWASPQVSVCHYGTAALLLAKVEIYEALEAAQKPNAPRIPGERQCKYCRALSVCPEAKAVVQQVALLPKQTRLGVGFTAEQHVKFWDLCQLAKRVIAAEEDDIKAVLLENPDAIPGLRLKPGAVKSTITDVRPIYERLRRDYSVSGEEFAEIVKVTKKDLTALVKRATGFKGGELESHIETILDGCTTESQNAPSLERVKEV